MDHTSDEDVWHVQLPSGDVCMMTLELLDDAFQDGLIHERSLVWKEGSPGWLTLAEVAGLDEEPSPPSSQLTASPDSADQPYSMGPLSTPPVAADIGDMDFDLEAVSFRPRKRSGWRWVAASALVGAAALGFAKRGAIVSAVHVPAISPGSLSNAAGAMIAAPALPATIQPPAAAPTPASTSDTRFSDETRRALEEADKKLAAKQQQKQQQLQQSRETDRPKTKLKSENPFHKGGSKYDPLNASL